MIVKVPHAKQQYGIMIQLEGALSPPLKREDGVDTGVTNGSVMAFR